MSKRKKILLFLIVISSFTYTWAQDKGLVRLEFMGDTIQFYYSLTPNSHFTDALSPFALIKFTDNLEQSWNPEIIPTLLAYRDLNKLDDWLFYQLIRKTAQQLSPKSENYFSYTLYKWFLLTRSGYDAHIRISENKMLLYVQSDEIIYNIPFLMNKDKQYVCLNYHDYGSSIDFEKEHFSDVAFQSTGLKKAFTYTVTQLPPFNPVNYVEKDLQFNYYKNEYHFKVKLNPELKNLFVNYPARDYINHFNIPLSRETYNSLIPQLKKVVYTMNTTGGIDYLMRFTRYAFLFEKDSEVFGKEKRFSPEETLLYEKSDCEDRAALFFYLVKEIYDLPMLVLTYPNHVTIAVKLDKPIGKPIIFNGEKYSLCEPTPQKTDLTLGQRIPGLKKVAFEIAYAYSPTKR
jgi:hypothetical protein